MTTTPSLIAGLAQEFRPARPIRGRNGRILAILTLVATMALSAVWFGSSSSMNVGISSPVFVLSNGLLLLLGVVSAFSAVNMAQPRVGNDHSAPVWVMATVGLLPLAAVGAVFASTGSRPELMGYHNLACFGIASVFATLTAAALLYWLRRGATVSPERAGLLAGVGAGAMGSFGYGIFCPILTMAHLGVWHVLPVLVWGLLGRTFFPRFIRW